MDAEYAILMALMIAPNKALELDLEPRHFAVTEAAAMYAAIRGLLADGKPVDPLTLRDRGVPLAFVSEISRGASGSPASVGYYADAIKRGWKRRELDRLGRELCESANQREADPDQLASRLIVELTELSREVEGFEYGMDQLMTRMLERIDRRVMQFKSGKTVGVPFGFLKWDQTLGGLQPARLYVLGGRPKMGKTAFAVCGIMNAARRGYKVGFASAEMSADECADRFAAIVAGVDADKISRGALSDADCRAITDASRVIAKLPIRILDLPACRPADIMRQARAWKLQHGLDLLVVDYLQRLKPDAKADRRDLEVGEMCRAHKSAAKALNIPVLLLAQLSRDLERRENKRPVMADLRDSGEIEQEADVIAFVYRDCVYNDTAPEDQAEILIQGNRHGPTGTIDMRFIAERMLWCDSDLARQESRYA